MSSTITNSQTLTPAETQVRRPAEMIAVVAFVVISLLAPAFVGEMYPFTVSPMFRDQPKHYCTYKLNDEAGDELDLKTYGLHLVYDGNPSGLGMGIEAPATLHGFGEVPDRATIIEHLRAITATQKDSPREIHVQQTVVACDGVRPSEELRRIVFSTDAAAEGN